MYKTLETAKKLLNKILRPHQDVQSILDREPLEKIHLDKWNGKEEEPFIKMLESNFNATSLLLKLHSNEHLPLNFNSTTCLLRKLHFETAFSH